MIRQDPNNYVTSPLEQSLNETQTLFKNPTIDLKTFMLLIDDMSSNRDFDSSKYYCPTPVLFNIGPILRILSLRTKLQEPIQSVMALQHSNAIHHLMNSENKTDQQSLISYLGMYPRFKDPKGSTVPPLFVNIPGYSGNRFWVQSQNLLFEKVQSRLYTQLKESDIKNALILAIMSGNKEEISDIFSKVQNQWMNSLWVKLYAFYRQQLLKRLLDIEKLYRRDYDEKLMCLENSEYSLDDLNWDMLEREGIEKNSLDEINFYIIRNVISNNTIDANTLFQKLQKLVIHSVQYSEVAMKCMLYLNSKIPSPNFRSNLLKLVQYSSLQQQILPVIQADLQKIISFYINNQRVVDPFKFEKFHNPQLRSQIAKRYLDTVEDSKNVLVSVQHLIQPSEKIKYIIRFLPTLRCSEVKAALQMIKPFFLNQRQKAYSRTDLKIYQNYSKLFELENSQFSEKNFLNIYNFLKHPYEQINGTKPPQFNKYILGKLIIIFYKNALYLIEKSNYTDKASVFNRSKQMVWILQAYINKVLTPPEIAKTLHKGLYQILIRDQGMLNDIQIRGQ